MNISSPGNGLVALTAALALLGACGADGGRGSNGTAGAAGETAPADASTSGPGGGGSTGTAGSAGAASAGSGGNSGAAGQVTGEAGSRGGAGAAGTGTAGKPDGGSDGGAAGKAGSGDAGIDPALETICTPQGVFDNKDPNGGGKVFLMYVPHPEAFIATAAHDACVTLYRHAAEVKTKPMVTLHVQTGDGVADSDGEGSQTRFYSGYIQSFASSHTAAQTLFELNGVLHHEFTHLYQNFNNDFDGALVEGVADFVRYRTGFIPLSHRSKGGDWTDGYEDTAFFLVYLDDLFPSFVYNMNQAVPHWPANNGFFMTTTGKSIDALWSDYQGSL